MQCASCRFENMPGVEACGRCGSPLRLATAVIDVNPPRARPWQKRLRRLFPVHRAGAGAREAMREANRRTGSFFELRELPVPPGNVLVRMLIPGWAHYYLGERTWGRAVAAIYLALLLPAIVLIGTFTGSILLGLAFSAHAGSSLSILFRYGGEALGRWRMAFLVLAVLALGVYLPLQWAISRVATPVTLNVVGPPFAAGDVLLINPSAYLFSPPKAGDIVLFESGARQTTLVGQGHAALNIAGGERIDRILACPGDQVSWDNGRLTVNGQESPVLPLNPGRALGSLVTRVPSGQYLIITTAFPYVDARVPADFWQESSLVPIQNIRAKVYLRTQPFGRFGSIR